MMSLSPQVSSRLQLLVLSNGHGEDVIAVSIVRELQQQENPPDIFALPLVGTGSAYQKLGIPSIGAVQTMPSGGFVYMDSKQLIRDVRGGLVQLTRNQIQAVRGWVSSQKKLGNHCAILAVGDIVPLLFAYISGANYAFVGTAKSEYYVRDEVGLLARTSKSARWENFSGSIYHPWERWLMSRDRCLAVFPRDELTTQILQKMSVPAVDVGNPMMDNLQPRFSAAEFYCSPSQEAETAKPLVITLLPGSRPPEAYANWEVIIKAVSAFGENYSSLVFLAAIAPGLELSILSATLKSQGWEISHTSPVTLPDPDVVVWQKNHVYLLLTQTAYNDCLHRADLAIAMAGTATEQFVGLGKPAIAIPGTGPQYNPAFAEAQSRLLGTSLFLVDNPQQVSHVADSLLQNPERLQIICENGIRRMGKPGAARRIADYLSQKFC
jgi:uncharacterized protein (TIGR03492 family)